MSDKVSIVMRMVLQVLGNNLIVGFGLSLCYILVSLYLVFPPKCSSSSVHKGIADRCSDSEVIEQSINSRLFPFFFSFRR